ncbi:MAG TPA: DUF1540 domain-containing protein [Syntrophothermus lipocalidus]|nr:DUF1540 domain-containing protein [Syntrophothermus lipocalidus]
MSRTTTECMVNTCAYWVPGNSCSADTIEVVSSGPDASCSTFTLRSSVEGPEMKILPQHTTSSLTQGSANPEVLCSVRQCRHNRDGYCEADNIKIMGSTAQRHSDTECDMFEPA